MTIKVTQGHQQLH